MREDDVTAGAFSGKNWKQQAERGEIDVTEDAEAMVSGVTPANEFERQRHPVA